MHPLKNIVLATATLAVLGAHPLLASAAQGETGPLIEARQEGSIWTAFALNRHLSAFDIKVAVEKGTARLSGKVENEVERELAERIALDVEGIDKVDNQLQIDPAVATEADARNGLAQRFEDATLVATIKSKLLWSNVTQGLEIDVTSDQGVVTLKGRAQSPEAKELAGNLATNTDGVASVNNLISISAADSIAAKTQPQALSTTEQMSDAWVTSKVKSSLIYSRNIDGLGIKVDTREGVVTLNGMVANFAEKELAVEIARNIRGVKGVNADALKVMARSTG
ncbi:BON domain-containing protein [Pseudomonas sp. 21LCFQ02]|uniref:BON domain-containing protein n=1 Tax=unclassified Pseudomonas TaxID=196821 RepID=UPI0004F8B994|nr:MULTISPECIES: BON domain-containing protein [unclassified Pseudomonas]MCO8162448.1 BON domain-containing protein [Pseudomonas sp. 21LCFQ010]MCO8168964.1 BON domain-containing protein [Pseudomonas sp. 21LCFQ02]MCQ9423569.1 BON domain-containing protein [Pseudomonas sp. LJDD11]BAP42331.1 transport-associated protein [Pseudomonas sp. StFLB209]